jgi:hypothetical protein
VPDGEHELLSAARPRSDHTHRATTPLQPQQLGRWPAAPVVPSAAGAAGRAGSVQTAAEERTASSPTRHAALVMGAVFTRSHWWPRQDGVDHPSIDHRHRSVAAAPPSARTATAVAAQPRKRLSSPLAGGGRLVRPLREQRTPALRNERAVHARRPELRRLGALRAAVWRRRHHRLTRTCAATSSRTSSRPANTPSARGQGATTSVKPSSSARARKSR